MIAVEARRPQSGREMGAGFPGVHLFSWSGLGRGDAD
jgi:hypothetical protein